MAAMRNVLRNAGLNLVGQGLPILVALVSVPFVLLSLGDARFGILTIAWLIIGTSQIVDLGMARAVTKFSADAISRDALSEISSILRGALWIQVPVGILAGGLLAVSASSLAESVFVIPDELIEETRDTLFVVGASIPVALLTGSYRGLLEAAGRFDIVNVFRVIFSSLSYLIPLAGGLVGWGLVEMTLLLLLSRAVQLYALHRICMRLYPVSRWLRRPEWKQLRNMLGFGGWAAISSVLGPLQENVERFMLAALLPIALVTYYAVPLDMLVRIYILPASLATVLFPAMAFLTTGRFSEILDLYLSSFKIVSLAVSLILLAVFILADPMLRLWVGVDFSEHATPVVRVLVLGIFASSLNLLAFSFYHAVGRPDVPAKQQIFRLPIICGLAWFLISEYGIVGAAAAWTFGRVLALVMNLGALPWMMRMRLSAFLPRQVVVAMAALPITMCLSALALNWGAIPAVGLQLFVTLFGTLALLLVFLSWVFSKEERHQLYLMLFRFK